MWFQLLSDSAYCRYFLRLTFLRLFFLNPRAIRNKRIYVCFWGLSRCRRIFCTIRPPATTLRMLCPTKLQMDNCNPSGSVEDNSPHDGKGNDMTTEIVPEQTTLSITLLLKNRNDPGFVHGNRQKLPVI